MPLLKNVKILSFLASSFICLQEERMHRKGVHFVCDLTHRQLSATHRSAHQDVQGADGGMS